MAGDLGSLRVDLSSLVAPRTLRGVQDAMGAEAKRVAQDEARRDLGSDRAMSGLRRRNAALNAGYDLEPSQVLLNLRPAGLWRLADKGRRDVDRVYPRGKRSGRRVSNKKQALSTPWGPRAFVRGSQTRPMNTIEDTIKEARLKVPKAAADAMSEHIERTF